MGATKCLTLFWETGKKHNNYKALIAKQEKEYFSLLKQKTVKIIIGLPPLFQRNMIGKILAPSLGTLSCYLDCYNHKYVNLYWDTVLKVFGIYYENSKAARKKTTSKTHPLPKTPLEEPCSSVEFSAPKSAALFGNLTETCNSAVQGARMVWSFLALPLSGEL